MRPQSVLYLKQNEHVVTIENEPSVIYEDRLAASPTEYASQYIVGEARSVTSAHGVKYGEPDVLHSCLILASGGPTGVHSRSALLHDSKCILAVSSFLICLHLPELNMLWQTQVDMATCFGVYHVPKYDSLISHGELDIARVSYDGNILWSSGGKDIFTNGFTLYDQYVEVRDFNDETYHIDLLTGRSEIVQA
jgi:hypothetical protein